MPVYELRTYSIQPGKMDAIKSRFVNHGLPHLAKHGIEVVSFWERDTPEGGELIYICKFEDESQVKERWDNFRADPSWQQAKAESERDGPLVREIKSVVMQPASFWQGKE